MMPGRIGVFFHDRWTLSAKRPVMDSQASRKKAANHKATANLLGGAESAARCELGAAVMSKSGSII